MQERARMTLTTGSEEELQILKARDQYFDSVLQGHGLPRNHPHVEIETKALGIEEPSAFRASEDRIHLLIIRDQVVAVCIDRRNTFNYHEVTFLKPTL